MRVCARLQWVVEFKGFLSDNSATLKELGVVDTAAVRVLHNPSVGEEEPPTPAPAPAIRRPSVSGPAGVGGGKCSSRTTTGRKSWYQQDTQTETGAIAAAVVARDRCNSGSRSSSIDCTEAGGQAI